MHVDRGQEAAQIQILITVALHWIPDLELEEDVMLNNGLNLQNTLTGTIESLKTNVKKPTVGNLMISRVLINVSMEITK